MKVIVYDMCRFGQPVEGVVTGMRSAKDALRIRLTTSNTSFIPVGSTIWVHRKQCRLIPPDAVEPKPEWIEFTLTVNEQPYPYRRPNDSDVTVTREEIALLAGVREPYVVTFGYPYHAVDPTFHPTLVGSIKIDPLKPPTFTVVAT